MQPAPVLHWAHYGRRYSGTCLEAFWSDYGLSVTPDPIRPGYLWSVYRTRTDGVRAADGTPLRDWNRDRVASGRVDGHYRLWKGQEVSSELFARNEAAAAFYDLVTR